MKFIYTTAILTLFGLNVLAQSLPIDEETKKITYTEAVEVDTLTKDVLFDRAKKWVTTKCDDKKPDIVNLEKGEVVDEVSFIIKLTYDFKYKKEAKVTFTMTTNQKDGKYRYIMDNFRIYDLKSGERSQEPLEAYYAKLRHNSKPEFVTQVDTEAKALIEDFKKLMEKGELVKKDDW